MSVSEEELKCESEYLEKFRSEYEEQEKAEKRLCVELKNKLREALSVVEYFLNLARERKTKIPSPTPFVRKPWDFMEWVCESLKRILSELMGYLNERDIGIIPYLELHRWDECEEW